MVEREELHEAVGAEHLLDGGDEVHAAGWGARDALRDRGPGGGARAMADGGGEAGLDGREGGGGLEGYACGGDGGAELLGRHRDERVVVAEDVCWTASCL